MKKLNKEKIALHHQELLTKKFKALHVNLSEYSFANLYLFRELHKYEVLMDDEIYIEGQTREGTPFVMLTALPPVLPDFLQDRILYPITNKWLKLFNTKIISFDEKEADYLYYTDKLARFPGRHLSKKRNLVKQLFTDHHIEVRPLLHLEEGLHVLEQWQREQPADEKKDFLACKEALELHALLQLDARIVYVDGTPSGFTIGEALNESCYAIHFCKANKHIKGLYQYLYQDCALTVASPYEWINLEQDLGSPQLHQAKHSYLPDRMEQKFRIIT